MSLTVESLYVESSEMEQLIERQSLRSQVPRILYLDSAIRLPFCKSEGLRLASCNDWVLFHVEESLWL